jgi:protocatechuate 3,4-dioxygenase beta subunit
MKRTLILAIFGSLCLSSAVYAEPQCSATAALATDGYPGAATIPTSNNLILPSGKSIESEGQKLFFSARLVDKECKPIPEAMIELWHVDPFGKRKLADKNDLATPYPVFAGAGRAITDSDGRVTFTTAFPGVRKYWVGNKKTGRYVTHAPQLNVRIKPPHMAEFSTVLFFENDGRNYADPVYKKLSIERRRTVTMYTTPQEEDVSATIEIVLPNAARYRTY